MFGDIILRNFENGCSVPYKIELPIDFKLAEKEGSPLPLTEDILKANGFECFVLPNHKKLYSYNNKEIILFWNDGAEIDLLGVSRTIISVHELQHALRLCGLNELADNFKIEGV